MTARGYRAHAILDQRLAAGEIDHDEYRERLQVLDPPRVSRPSTRRWLPVVLLGVAALALVGLLLVMPGMAGGDGPGPMGGDMNGMMTDHMDGMMGQRSNGGTAPAAISGATELTVEAGDLWFAPDRIDVVAGEPTNSTLDNGGESFHDLTIDELDLQIDAEAGQRTTAGLQIDEPGTYEFYCSVPGHASAGMRGTLTVVEGDD